MGWGGWGGVGWGRQPAGAEMEFIWLLPRGSPRVGSEGRTGGGDPDKTSREEERALAQSPHDSKFLRIVVKTI